MNLPNKLTLGRLVLCGVFVAIMSIPFPLHYTLALVVFVAASITDYYDGKIARERGLITNFGKLMDPLADKVLLAAALVLLVGHDLIPAWAVVLVLAREFLVTGLRLIASSQGSVLAADSLGKQKTIIQIVTVIYFLLFLAASERIFYFLRPAYSVPALSPKILGTILIASTVALTLISGVGYLTKNRKLLTGT